MAAGEASGLRYPCLMRVTVQYLRMLKEFAGWDSATAEVPDGTSLGGLLDELQQRMPQRSQFRGASAMAVNYEYSGSERPLRNDDEVGADSSCQRRQAGRTSLQCDAADADDRARGPGAATHRRCSDPGGGVSRRQWLRPGRGSRANPLGREVGYAEIGPKPACAESWWPREASPRFESQSVQSDRCPVSSVDCDRLTPLHGDNRGSKPAADVNSMI